MMPPATTPRPSFSVHSASGLPQPGQLSGKSLRSLVVIIYSSSWFERRAKRAVLRLGQFASRKRMTPTNRIRAGLATDSCLWSRAQATEEGHSWASPLCLPATYGQVPYAEPGMLSMERGAVVVTGRYYWIAALR